MATPGSDVSLGDLGGHSQRSTSPPIVILPSAIFTRCVMSTDLLDAKSWAKTLPIFGEMLNVMLLKFPNIPVIAPDMSASTNTSAGGVLNPSRTVTLPNTPAAIAPFGCFDTATKGFSPIASTLGSGSPRAIAAGAHCQTVFPSAVAHHVDPLGKNCESFRISPDTFISDAFKANAGAILCQRTARATSALSSIIFPFLFGGYSGVRMTPHDIPSVAHM